MARFVLGVTGASGAVYAMRTAMHLKRLGHAVSLIVTAPGREVVEYEGQTALFDLADKTFNVDDFFAECASGSADYAGMAVVPCSMGTLGRIASGTSDNLLVRSADVCLKERRPLDINETLVDKIVDRVTRAGAVVIPASPQFYSRPATIEELVDTVVAKILKHLGAASAEACAGIVKPWEGGEPDALGGPLC